MNKRHVLELLILTSACSGRQSLYSDSRLGFVVPHAHTATKQHRAFSTVVPLPGTDSHLNCTYYLGVWQTPPTNSLSPWVVTLMWCYINFLDI